MGRFLQLDPAGFVDGMNRYQYAGGNPLAFTDPSGCGFWSALGEICSSAVSAAVATVQTAAVVVAAVAVGAAMLALPVLPVVAAAIPLVAELTAANAVCGAIKETSMQVAEACGADPQTAKLVGDVTELTLIVVPATISVHRLGLASEAAFARRAKELGSGGRAAEASAGATPGGSVQGEPPPHAYRGERPQGTGGSTRRLPSKSETPVKVEVTGAAAEPPTPAAGAQKTGGTTPGLRGNSGKSTTGTSLRTNCPEIHGNSRDSERLCYLYRRYDRNGKFLKWGITQDLKKRYSLKTLDGGSLVPYAEGTRSEMLDLERLKVETEPGPLNRERWAGKRLGEAP